MPRVYNKHGDDVIPPDAVYVGRPSKWGNPFVIGINGSRDDVVMQYRRYLEKSPALLTDLHELKGKDLVCWCAPRACHADVLLEKANEP
jgi:hypothetical protein